MRRFKLGQPCLNPPIFHKKHKMGRGGDGKHQSVRRFTAAEVAKHRSAGDAWLSIRGKVRDALGLKRSAPKGLMV